jgi:hypothetical protein
VKTVTLCGSTRFKDDFDAAEARLTLEGNAVYSCAIWGHRGVPTSEEEKLMLDAVHMAKIANSEEVYVVNPGGYVGESTRREVYAAAIMGKKITFQEPDNEFAQKWTRTSSPNVINVTTTNGGGGSSSGGGYSTSGGYGTNGTITHGVSGGPGSAGGGGSRTP